MATITLTLKDYSNEQTRTELRLADVTDTAGEATIIAGRLAALKTAIEGVTKGTYVQARFANDPVKYSNVAPNDSDAQRERKIVVFYQDNTTFDVYRSEIGTADVAALTIPAGSDEVTLADGGVMAALVTELETNYVTKNGNALTVLRAQLVGRNL